VIVRVDASNLSNFVDLSALLFPDESFEEQHTMYTEYFNKETHMGFLYQANDQYAGMVHLSIRYDYVNGTDTSPVIFIEAIYVLPDYRKHGVGKALINHAEAFAKEKGITQLASDCLIENTASERFHKSCGFREEERVICLVKDIV